MKTIIVSKFSAIGTVFAAGLLLASMSFRNPVVRATDSNITQAKDTIPGADININVDVQKALEEASKAIAAIDFSKIMENVQQALKEVDMQKIQLQIQESLKNIDLNKIQKEVDASLKSIDWNSVNKSIDS